MLTRSVFSGVVVSLVTVSLLFAGPVAYASPLPLDASLTDEQVAAAVAAADPSDSPSTVKQVIASGNRVSSGRITMTLPDATGKVSTVSGARTYRGAKASYAVRGTADGIQAFSVVSSATGPREFRYDFPGEYLTFEHGMVVASAGSASGAPLGLITPAWAKDATGKPVDTWYSIVDNTTLVQHINPTASTKYPIVADPRIVFLPFSWTRPNGVFVSFDSAEQTAIAAGAGAAIAAALFKNPWVAGAAATVVGTAYAHGICTGGRDLLVLITTGWAWATCM